MVNGSRRWLSAGGVSFQPSEFVKFIVPIFLIHSVVRTKKEMKFSRFLKIIAIAVVPMVLVMLEPDNGTTAIIGLTVVATLFITRVPWKYWGIPMCIFTVVALLVGANMPYVQARLKVYFNPELDIHGKGHQAYQAKIAAGSGGVTGRGPGRSMQKLSYLPEAQNDYIAAIYAEEFGFLGVLLLITLYMLFVYLGLHIAYQCPDPEGFYLASVLTFLIAIQAFLNLGVVSGLLPSTGLNLPLFSQGGTSLMTNIIGVGLMLEVAKRGEREV
jgi:cell division protein FtsW